MSTLEQQSTKRASRVARIVLPILIVGGSVFAASVMMRGQSEARTPRPPPEGTLVTTVPAVREAHRFDVVAQGQVIAAKELNVQAEVMGRLSSMHPNLVPGGLIARGDTLFALERSQYQLALAERRTGVADAEARLQKEEGQQRVAKREWELFHDGPNPESASGLALRKPEHAQAKAAVAGAKARLSQARLDLGRTRFKAPFDAIVTKEGAEMGQLVTSQNAIATLVGTEEFWVRISVPVAELGYLAIPGVNASIGSEALVSWQQGEQKIERAGRVVRMLGEVDKVGTMARLVVAIDDPLGLKIALEERDAPMLLGSFVQVRIVGKRSEELFVVDRSHLRDGTSVFVANTKNELEVRTLEIVRADADMAFVRTGLKTGERIISSAIQAPLPGMALRVQTSQTQAPADTTGKSGEVQR